MDQDWPDWSFEVHTELLCKHVLSSQKLATIEAATSPIAMPTEKEEAEKCQEIFYLLAKSCRGPASLILRKVEHGNGHEAWRQLHHRFTRVDADSTLSLLNCILSFGFGDLVSLEDKLNSFDLLMQNYNAAAHDNEQLPENVIKMIYLQRMPEPLKAQLDKSRLAQA